LTLMFIEYPEQTTGNMPGESAPNGGIISG
jgi:hypothetical protein